MTTPKRTPYGFDFGPAEIECVCSDEKKGWVMMRVITKKYPSGIQIYVTKSGKLRVFGNGKEWTPE